MQDCVRLGRSAEVRRWAAAQVMIITMLLLPQ